MIKTLAETIVELRAADQEFVAALQRDFNQRIEERGRNTEFTIDVLLAQAGKRRCPSCGGYGAHERLDAGYMRRFNLPEWNGCPTCGGARDKKGCGFVGVDEVVTPVREPFLKYPGEDTNDYKGCPAAPYFDGETSDE